jgi:chromate reductase
MHRRGAVGTATLSHPRSQEKRMDYEVAVFVGSLRAASYNLRLARALEKLMPANIKFTYANLAAVPLYNQDLDNNMPQQALDLKALVARSQALLFVTPEHNRSIPAALKNAIDWCSRPPGKNSWTGKPSGIVGISPSAVGTGIAQQHLRAILAAEGTMTLTLPEVFLQWKDGLIDDNHDFGSDATRKFLQDWVDRYAAWIAKFD